MEASKAQQQNSYILSGTIRNQNRSEEGGLDPLARRSAWTFGMNKKSFSRHFLWKAIYFRTVKTDKNDK